MREPNRLLAYAPPPRRPEFADRENHTTTTHKDQGYQNIRIILVLCGMDCNQRITTSHAMCKRIDLRKTTGTEKHWRAPT